MALAVDDRFLQARGDTPPSTRAPTSTTGDVNVDVVSTAARCADRHESGDDRCTACPRAQSSISVQARACPKPGRPPGTSCACWRAGSPPRPILGRFGGCSSPPASWAASRRSPHSRSMWRTPGRDGAILIRRVLPLCSSPPPILGEWSC